MLSAQDNELMCRVGPGTVMGDLMRQYWIPAVMSSELATVDCPPMRLRLLGENLIAFRDTASHAGVFVNACPHRGASMFFGRNEEEGLRCVYHGWKFDVSGTCVDMPSEPPESNFKSKVRIKAYPCQELNGIIWTYMGPRETPPPLPNHPGAMSPNCRVTKSVRTCSYMQALEGDIDTVHQAILHHGAEKSEEFAPGSASYYAYKQRYAHLYVEEHEGGTSYGAYRPAEDDTDNWRMGHFLLPFYTFNAPGILTQKTGGNVWVPIDDDHCMVWGITVPAPAEVRGKPAIGGLFEAARFGVPLNQGGGANRSFQPDTTDWIGKFRSVQTAENDYLIDRGVQARMESYTGIPGGAEPEDRGMQESMGPIYDRTEEHLGTTDMMIIASRRKLIKAAKELRAKGSVPAGVDNPDLYWMFSGGALVPKGVNGLEYCRDVLYGRARTVEVQATAR